MNIRSGDNLILHRVFLLIINDSRIENTLIY